MAIFSYFWLIWVVLITVVFGDTSFQPRLQWICTPSSIVLTIITENPFDGIGHSLGYRTTCSVTGNGTTETNLIISLNEKFDDQCGVKFDTDTGNYWVEVEVHYHNAVISENDKIFNVTCSSSTSMSYQPEIDYYLELYPFSGIKNFLEAENQATNETSEKSGYGKTYILDAFMASIDDVIKYRNRFQMTNCIVESEDGTALEIIDSNGCSSNPKYSTDVVYKDEWASVNLSSVNPYLTVLKLKCKFSICDEAESCRPNCDRHWYDSIVKGTKNFANLLGVGSESSKPMNDHFLSKSKSTIVYISVPIEADNLPPQTNFFMEKCQNIDVYFFSFEHCCTSEKSYWLFVAIGLICLILVASVLWNFVICCRRIKTAKKEDGNDSDSVDYWCYEDFKNARKSNEDEPLPRRKSLLRRFSKRRRYTNGRDDEIYATIKSRSSTHAIKIAPPLSQVYEIPSKVVPLSQVFENPYITLPSFVKPPKLSERGSSIEENPAYVCQKISQ